MIEWKIVSYSHILQFISSSYIELQFSCDLAKGKIIYRQLITITFHTHTEYAQRLL